MRRRRRRKNNKNEEEEEEEGKGGEKAQRVRLVMRLPFPLDCAQSPRAQKSFLVSLHKRT